MTAVTAPILYLWSVLQALPTYVLIYVSHPLNNALWAAATWLVANPTAIVAGAVFAATYAAIRYDSLTR